MDEFLKALELVDQFDGCRPVLTKEFRLYYNEDGSIIGLWETDYPTGNYIVLDDPSVFYNSNTLLLRVIDGKLKKIEIAQNTRTQLVKSMQGQRVVRGMAAIALTPAEEYQDVEYYDRKTNN